MKRLSFLIFLTVISGLSAQEDITKLLNEIISTQLDTFRDKMRTGFPEFGFPPVDPVIFDPKKLHIKKDIADVVLDLPEISVTGLSEFFLDLKTPSARDIIVTLYLDDLAASGRYNVTGKVIRIFPIYGEGNFQVSSAGSFLRMVGEFSMKEDVVVFSTKSFEFDFDELHLNFENFLGGKSVGQMIQKVLPMFAKSILETVQPEIEKVGKPRIEALINSVVQHDEVQALLKPLLN